MPVASARKVASKVRSTILDNRNWPVGGGGGPGGPVVPLGAGIPLQRSLSQPVPGVPLDRDPNMP